MSYDLVYPYDKVNDDDDKNHDDGMRLKIIILCQKRSKHPGCP